jgi:hypothetical protein
LISVIAKVDLALPVKILIIGLHLLILLAGTATLYGTLVSMVNIIEGILLPFTSDPSTAGTMATGSLGVS